jgi:hypothetical protein
VRENVSESDEKGPAARRRPKIAREAYFLYVDRAIEGANAADGPFSSLSDHARDEGVAAALIGRLSLARVAIDQRPQEHRVRQTANFVLDGE